MLADALDRISGNDAASRAAEEEFRVESFLHCLHRLVDDIASRIAGEDIIALALGVDVGDVSGHYRYDLVSDADEEAVLVAALQLFGLESIFNPRDIEPVPAAAYSPCEGLRLDRLEQVSMLPASKAFIA